MGYLMLNLIYIYTQKNTLYIYIYIYIYTHNVCFLNSLSWGLLRRSENCSDELAQRTVNRILRGRDTCSHSKVEHCY